MSANPLTLGGRGASVHMHVYTHMHTHTQLFIFLRRINNDSIPRTML